MILSVSRRTDIPGCYSEWFFNRIKEGFVCVRNPMNPRQVSRIALSPETVDCIVFWTKNPEPMLGRLSELEGYACYFQFTLTCYGQEVESGLPSKEKLMGIFQELSGMLGKERVIWRYDPILFTPVYTPEYHLKAFEEMAKRLSGNTERCVISFVDQYAKNKKGLAALLAYELPEKELKAFAGELAQIAGRYGLAVGSCAEKTDLSGQGIFHNCCIDRELIERLTGCSLKAGKDKGQRPECGCAESMDIGAYHTCPHGCVYCYANESWEKVEAMRGKYDPASPVLCGRIDESDQVTERKIKSLKERQLRLPGL